MKEMLLFRVLQKNPKHNTRASPRWGKHLLVKPLLTRARFAVLVFLFVIFAFILLVVVVVVS